MRFLDVALVLRALPPLATGQFRAEHVTRLLTQIDKYWPPEHDKSSIILTDAAPPKLPDEWWCKDQQLKHGWPGWWSKMELFAPGFREADLLYFDLDTTIVGSLKTIVDAALNAGLAERPILLSDFYRPDFPASGMMFLPAPFRDFVWRKWIANPDHHMKKYRGDQDFLYAVLKESGLSVDRWQDLVPGAVVSYKVHVLATRLSRVPADASVVCFHGPPRPWNIKELSR